MNSGGGAAGRVRVAICAAYPSVRAGLRALLAQDERIDVVAEAPDMLELDDTARGLDVLLVDLERSASLAQIEDLLESAPDTAVVLLGASDGDARLVERLGPRAWGFLLREAGAAEIASAITAVAQGLVVLQPPLAQRLLAAPPLPVLSDTSDAVESLTNREHEVLQLVAQGLPNKTIALRLQISEHTVKFHLTSILAKLGASSRTEAVRLGARRGLIVL